MSDPKRDLFRINEDFASHMRLLDILRSTGEDTAPLEKTIAEYFSHEVTRDKIDSVINYIRHCDLMATAANDEAKRLNALTSSWITQREWLKNTAKAVLEASGAKRLEGSTAGHITLVKNGGKQAVEVTDASLVPESLCDFEGKIPGGVMCHFREVLRPFPIMMETLIRCLKRTPSLSRIAAEMDKPCERCKGRGHDAESYTDTTKPCDACGGSGKQGVGGCRLADRGSHVEIR